MSDTNPPPSESESAPASPPPRSRFFPSAGAEIGCGAALSAILPTLVVVVLALLEPGRPGARMWQEVGVILFLLVVPAVVIATIVAIIPKSRRFGLGMLLGSGVLLLLSLLTCSIR